MSEGKKRVIKSLENLTDDLRDLIKRQYPTGYEGSLTRIVTPKKEPIFVFPLEDTDTVILVKVPVTKNSGGGYDVDSKSEKEEFDNSDDDESSDDSEGGDDDDLEGDSKSGREASYEPDFDA